MMTEARKLKAETPVQLRDLIWAVNSPSLLAAGPPDGTCFIRIAATSQRATL